MCRLVVALLAMLVAATPAWAGWREDLKVLRVGFLAGDNPAQQVARMEKFRWQLQYGLALPVELFPARSYQALIEAESSGRIQYAILSSLAFVALDQACRCAEPIVQPVAENAARGVRAVLVSRTDGPIVTLADARGARVAVARPDSIAGRLVPMAALEREGIETNSYFARLIETPDSLVALRELAAGNADLAVAWSTALDPLSVEPGAGPIADLAAEGLLPDGLRLVWRSDLIPFGPHVVRSDLPPQARAPILETLLGLQTANPDAYDAVERQYSGGFVAADPALYAHFAALMAETSKPE